MRAKEKAYSYVKAGILDKSLEEGEVFTEGKIASALGISRTPVREALLVLEAESLVKLLPRKGFMVPESSPREIREVMEARILIEEFSADKVIEKRSEIARGLEDLLRRQSDFAGADDVGHFIELDRQFHYLMVSNCGNDLLIKFYETLREKQVRMGIQAVAYSSERVREVIEEHSSIVKAAEEGDAEELRASIRNHLNATLSILKEHAFD